MTNQYTYKKWISKYKLKELYLTKNMSQYEIANMFKCSLCKIQKTLKRMNIKPKSKRIRNQLRENNSYWRGGKTKSTCGYILIRCPEHPFSRNGYIFEHRLKMEKKLKRYLKLAEKVHHKNGIKTDNRITNLKLMKNQSIHFKLEAKKKPRNTFGQFIKL